MPGPRAIDTPRYFVKGENGEVLVNDLDEAAMRDTWLGVLGEGDYTNEVCHNCLLIGHIERHCHDACANCHSYNHTNQDCPKPHREGAPLKRARVPNSSYAQPNPEFQR